MVPIFGKPMYRGIAESDRRKPKLTGEYVLLTSGQYSILAPKLGINGIPHYYTWIDRNGHFAQKSVTRPVNKA